MPDRIKVSFAPQHSTGILLFQNYTEEEMLNIFGFITHKQACGSLLKSSPRPISIGPLHALLHFHSRPIYLVVYKGSYQIAL